MTPLRCGHSSAQSWRAAADECLETAGWEPATAGDDAEGLGFVYVTDPFGPHLGAVVAHLREKTGVASWVGSVGLGIVAPGREYFQVPGMAVLLGGFPPRSFRVFDSVTSDFHAFDAAHGEWCAGHEPRFAVVHADPQNANVPRLVEGLSSRIGDGYLVGGLSSAETAIVQIADRATSGGISGVLLAPEVGVSTRITQGCTPIGERHEITRCERNIIVELDGRPALEVFKEDIGEILARDLRRVAGYIFVGLPIVGSDTGDYLVRNLVGVDPRTQIIAIGETVERGDRIMFCRRDAGTAEVDMHRMLEEIAKGLDAPPRGGLYFSCLARGPNLFGPNSEETRMIRDRLGDFPLVGMFANGEISHNRLYAYTGVLTLFT